MEKLGIGMHCPITEWKITKYDVKNDNHVYSIKNHEIEKHIWLSDECIGYAKSKQEIIRWLLFKNKIPTISSLDDLKDPSTKLITKELLKKAFSESYVPKTPKEKLDQFLIDLQQLFPKYEGNILENELLKFSLFRTKYELNLFLDSLTEKGFIRYDNLDYQEKRLNGGIISHKKGNYYLCLKFEGLDYLSELEKNSRYSNRCFIAMSFSKNDRIDSIKESIKNAVIETGYQPVLIDEVNYESEMTVNDAIISEIKKSKFFVADFTEQKNGVYFETGFALGLGLPVIYCCQDDDFKDSHFDLDHYPHIIYSSVIQLEEALKNKIKAWID